MAKTDKNRQRINTSWELPSSGSAPFAWHHWEVDCDADNVIGGTRYKGWHQTKPGRKLLLEFLKIRDRETALKYVAENGFPIQTSEISVEVLVAAAEGLRFVKDLMKSIGTNNLGLISEYIFLDSRTDLLHADFQLPPLNLHHAGFKTEIIDSANIITTEGAQQIKLARRNLKKLREIIWIEQTIAPDPYFLHTVDVTFVPSEPERWQGIFKYVKDSFDNQ